MLCSVILCVVSNKCKTPVLLLSFSKIQCFKNNHLIYGSSYHLVTVILRFYQIFEKVMIVEGHFYIS